MLRIIINQLKSKAEEILSEEQAGFGRAQSTVKQMFNGRVLVEKYLQHQKDFFHNFINFKDTFDHGSCVAQVSLQVMRNFNIDEELVQVVRVWTFLQRSIQQPAKMTASSYCPTNYPSGWGTELVSKVTFH